MKKHFIKRGIKFTLFFLGALALGGLAVMLLWNWLAPAIFGWSTISWLQALGLLALSRLLFGRFGGGGHRYRRSPYGGRQQWRRRWEERYAKMTPEEREKFRSKFGKKCGPNWLEETPEETQSETSQAS